MKNLKILIVVLLLLPSCQYLKKKFQSKNDLDQKRSIAQSNYHDTAHLNTFTSIMNEPLLITDSSGNTQQAFIERVREYFKRQFEYLYIGQFVMHDFDQELNRLVILKKSKSTLTDEDTEKINMLYFQLQVARIVYEANLHDLASFYILTLETRLMSEINDDADRKTKTTLVLSQLPKWLNEWWGQKLKIGTIALAEAMDDINTKFIASTPAAARHAVNVDQFIKISNRTRHQAYLETVDPEVMKPFKRLSSHIEGSAQKKYEEALAEQEKNPEKLMLPFFESEKRKPDAALDKLFPSAGGNGHISGNLVPKNTWTLTFDDGPHAKHTDGMYRVLNDNKVPATFFWLSKNMNAYPNIVTQARNNEKTNGNKFYVASHSMSHANLPTLNAQKLEVEISDAATLFHKIVGERPTLFRCPYGACGPMGSAIREVIAKNNMLHVHWNVDTLDWQDKNPQSIFERSKKQIELRGKGIVLFHDVHPQSVEALKILIPYMKSKKYRIISLPQMVTEIREEKFDSP